MFLLTACFHHGSPEHLPNQLRLGRQFRLPPGIPAPRPRAGSQGLLKPLGKSAGAAQVKVVCRSPPQLRPAKGPAIPPPAPGARTFRAPAMAFRSSRGDTQRSSQQSFESTVSSSNRGDTE